MTELKVGDVARRFEKVDEAWEKFLDITLADEEADDVEFIVSDGVMVFSYWESYEEALAEAHKSAEGDDGDYFVYQRVAAVTVNKEIVTEEY